MKFARPFAMAAMIAAMPAIAMAQDGPPPPAPGGFPGLPMMTATEYDAGLRIKDGAIEGAVQDEIAGTVTNPMLIENIAVEADRVDFNPIVISGGKSLVTLRNVAMALNGRGSNDFTGKAAGVIAFDKASLVLENVNIETHGAIVPALAVGQEAVVKVYNARLVTHGGPIPDDYKPRIGAGMMEPPAPLDLSGQARTVIGLTNSRTYIYNSYIESDGWGAISTDAAGSSLLMQVNNSKIVAKNKGYGTYSDFGADVEVNDSSITSGKYMGIIAGKAATSYSGVTGSAGLAVMMIHSIMAFDPTETATFKLKNVTATSEGPAILVKSANADISFDASELTSAEGVLLKVVKNDDRNATKVNGAAVPGVTMKITASAARGDVIDTDPERGTFVTLKSATLEGALQSVTFAADENSKWTATKNSNISLHGETKIASIDAVDGVTISAVSNTLPAGTQKLPSGGTLVIAAP